MSFRSLLTGIKEAYHLNPSYFGETVTYTPAPGGGAAREINVHIEEMEELDLEGDTEDKRRTIRVKVLKDATKGVLYPCIGDTIQRSTTHDADDRKYTYQGEHDNEAVDSWRLHFSRRQRPAQGVKGGK